MIQGSIQEAPSDPLVLETGLDIDPAQLPVLGGGGGNPNPQGAELDEADQAALGFGEQEDIFRQGMAEIALGEIALEMGGQIGGR